MSCRLKAGARPGGMVLAQAALASGADMGKRLTQIATRTGDDGTTGLADGSRVGKDHLRIAALGDVDELNSAIGLLATEDVPDAVRRSI
jgi:cob(I)alamin adenosyltransferase